MARLLADGTVDRSFGERGFASGPPAVCPCGRALLAGQRDGGFLIAQGRTLVRYTSDGRLDRTFGLGGRVLLAAGYAGGLAVAPDGSVVVSLVDDLGVALLRYRPDGTPDAAFGTLGRVRLDRVARPARIAVQADAKIVVSGGRAEGADAADIVLLARLRQDGSIDTSFGRDGFVEADGIEGDALAMQRDGTIVVAGRRGVETNVLRFLPDGRLDASFGGDGNISRTFGGRNGVPVAVVPLPTGAIAVAGFLFHRPPTPFSRLEEWLAARITADGTWVDGRSPGRLDPDRGCWFEHADALAVQADGRVLVGGGSCSGSFVGRYTPDFELDAGPRLVVRLLGGRRARAARSGGAVRVSAAITASAPAHVIVTVRRANAIEGTPGQMVAVPTGGPVVIRAGSSVGNSRLRRRSAALKANVGRSLRTRLRLLLPASAFRRGRWGLVNVLARDDRGRTSVLDIEFRSGAG